MTYTVELYNRKTLNKQPIGVGLSLEEAKTIRDNYAKEHNMILKGVECFDDAYWAYYKDTWDEIDICKCPQQLAN